MRIKVFVKPGSSQEKVSEAIVSDSEVERELTIWTHARAHDGEANKKVIELVSKYYRVPKTQIQILRGMASREKVIEF